MEPYVTVGLAGALVAALLWGVISRRRVRAASRLADSLRWRAAVDAVHGPCGLVDGQLRWQFINQRLADFFASSPDALLGQPVRNVVAASSWPSLAAELDLVVAGEQRHASSSASLRTGSTSELPVHLEAESIANSDLAVTGCLMTIRDETESQRQFHQLRLTERALHAATCAIVICDALEPDVPIVYANHAFELLTGYSATEVLGRNCRLLNEPEREQPALEEVRAALREHRETTVVLRNYRRDGSTFWNELTISPVSDSSGRVTHFLGMQDDVTERMEFAAEHERLLAESIVNEESAARAAKARETLLTVVSHELRSPLNAIRLWTSLLQSSPTVDADLVARAVEQIENGVTAQSRIIEDLLDVSRFESGRLELQRRAVELVELVRQAIGRNHPAAAEQGLALTFETAHPQATVLADPGRIDQVLQNLIDNALKFTPSGGLVEVSVVMLPKRVRVVVRDTGRGIAPEKLADVFQQFWQAEDRDTRTVGGLGLGLNLVRQIIENHDGVVEAHSDGLDQGASLMFELPLHATDRLPAAPLSPVIASGERLEGDVLIVDDDATTVEAIAIGLRMRGYAARVASGADQALGQIQERRPRLLISDLMMAGRSGFELMEAIRADEFENGFDRLPAIAITGRGGPNDRRDVRRSGFDRYLQKPVRMESLVTALEEILTSSRTTPGLRVLLACADRDRGEQLRQALAKHGHVVQVASSSADALALVDSNVPEALIAETELVDGPGETLLDSVYSDNSETLTALLGPFEPSVARGNPHAKLQSGDVTGIVRLLSRWLTL